METNPEKATPAERPKWSELSWAGKFHYINDIILSGGLSTRVQVIPEPQPENPQQLDLDIKKETIE